MGKKSRKKKKGGISTKRKKKGDAFERQAMSFL
jgi:hypothetical protein